MKSELNGLLPSVVQFVAMSAVVTHFTCTLLSCTKTVSHKFELFKAFSKRLTKILDRAASMADHVFRFQCTEKISIPQLLLFVAVLTGWIRFQKLFINTFKNCIAQRK